MIRKFYKLPVFWAIIISGFIMLSYTTYINLTQKKSNRMYDYSDNQQNHVREFMLYTSKKSGREEDKSWSNIHNTLLDKNHLKYKKIYQKHNIK